MAEGPTVNRRQLGAELRRLRTAAGISIEAVAEALGCSQTRISRIETAKGRATLKPDEISTLAELYQVTDERQVIQLLDMLTNSQKKGWWESYDEIAPSGLNVLVGLEADARTSLAWEPLVVHGLLQTADYAREVLRAWPGTREQDVEDLVRLRMERQRRLRSDHPLELWAVLDEAVIRRPVGGPAVMREQLLHLAEMSQLPTVTLQVLPMGKGANPGLSGAFNALDFHCGDPRVVYVDSPAGNFYLERPHDVRRYEATFNLLRALAHDPHETTALLRRAAKEMS